MMGLNLTHQLVYFGGVQKGVRSLPCANYAAFSAMESVG
jgi:hypothetical protein